jgi:hypothetical protein
MQRKGGGVFVGVASNEALYSWLLGISLTRCKSLGTRPNACVSAAVRGCVQGAPVRSMQLLVRVDEASVSEMYVEIAGGTTSRRMKERLRP